MKKYNVLTNTLVFLFILGLPVALTACGKKSTDTSTNNSQGGGGGGGSGGGGGGSSKSVLSVWDGGNGIWSLDFSGGNLSGTPFTATVTQDTGEVCDYDIELNGTESSGTCTIVTNGTYAGGGSGDPGCGTNSQMNICGTGTPTGTGGYTNTGSALSFSNNAIPFK